MVELTEVASRVLNLTYNKEELLAAGKEVIAFIDSTQSSFDDRAKQIAADYIQAIDNIDLFYELAEMNSPLVFTYVKTLRYSAHMAT